MLPIYNYFANEEDEEDRRREVKLQKRVLRDTVDAFELPEIEFRKLYRLNKNLCQNLINDLTPFMGAAVRTTRLSIEIRILAALRFFATGNYQRGICEEVRSSMSQQSVSNCIKEVASALEDIAGRWVQFPKTAIEKNQIKMEFMEKFGMPGVVGVVDGTHIAIVQPVEEEHVYFNRKGFHSKNCQIICDSNLFILSINANFGGSSHDAFIWRQSAIYTHMQANYQAGEVNSWLLGDSGYPQQPWLLTPVINPPENSPAARFNQCHKRTRNCVERCIGVLKTRFRCLLKDRVLKYSPNQVGIIINACVVLHNMCIRAGVPLDEEIEMEIEDDRHDNIEYDVLEEGRRVRDNVINLYFDI